MTRIPTIDLFSGIGGFSYALKALCKTVAYCEINPACQAVLRHNMARGILDRAPIIEDITKMDATECPIKPQMCTMGFPCQDITTLRPGKGLKGERSGLFKQAMKIIDTMPTINWILIENSSNIKNRGLNTVLRSLTVSGFKYTHSIFSAREVGAPHLRKRWICLCWRNVPFPLTQLSANSLHWSRGEKEARLIPRGSTEVYKQNKTRCSILGNSVVPQCIVHALCALSGSRDPSPYQEYPILNLVLRQGKSVYHKKMWMTPCFSTKSWEVYNLSARSAGVLVNQLYYSEDTFRLLKQNRTKCTLWSANPRFIEWMMGYPPDYTAVFTGAAALRPRLSQSR